jgi:rod shape-determining protein MreB
VRRAGVSSVKVVPEPLAAAVGAGLDISSPHAQAIIDFGAGVTDIAVIRSGVLINTAAVRLGCDSLYPAVRRMVMRHYGVVLFAREAERITRQIGLVHRSDEAMAASPPRGLDTLNGHERSIRVNGEEVSDAVRPIVNVIMETIKRAFSNLPTDVAAEVIEGGICLTGGGACLPGMRDLIAEVTSLEVKVAAEPLHALINGASQMLAVGERTGLWNGSNQRETTGTKLSEGCVLRPQ